MTDNANVVSQAEVDLWVFRLDALGRLDALQALLAPDEHERAGRFVYAEDRERFIIGRGLLRTILARYVGTHPEALEILAAPHGKPYLARPEIPLYFNLTHSGEYAAVALARDCEIGIDIEKIRKIEPGFAKRFFSEAENEAITCLPVAERQLAVIRCWSRKEAVLKAQGVGLLGDFKSFDVTVGADGMQRVAGLSGPWSLTPFTPAEGYVGALAARAACIQFKQKELSAIWP